MNSRNLPPAIAEYVEQVTLDFRSPAFLFVDPEGRVVAQGGALSHYGLQELSTGSRVAEEAYFLEGLLPSDRDRTILSRVETTAGVFADIHLFRVAEGDCVLLLDATEDVAERTQIEQALRETEERLRHAEKMEALGRLAGGVAHDFNNLLTVILGYSQMLVDTALASDSTNAAREINMAAKRAAGMTQHLLSFSRRQVRRIEVVDLNQLISDLERLLQRLIREDVALTTVLDPGLDCVEADRGQMEQILVNLAANARDAMPTGGTIEIRTGKVMVDEAYLRRHSHLQLRCGPHVSLSVADTGCGMDPETMLRAFEPFFTSKPVGQGTGLGLSIVYGIITQTGGDVRLTSEPGVGTRVEILLPAVNSTVTPEPAAEEMRGPRGSETVLVVEDEEGVRNLIRAILSTFGYRVLEYSEASEALAFCEQYPGTIDLLVTDLIMPRMDGRELARRIRIIRRELPVLYVSGYAVEGFANRGANLPGSLFLEKPFTPGRLAAKVREALARRKTMQLGSQQSA